MTQPQVIPLGRLHLRFFDRHDSVNACPMKPDENILSVLIKLHLFQVGPLHIVWMASQNVLGVEYFAGIHRFARVIAERRKRENSLAFRRNSLVAEHIHYMLLSIFLV